MWLADYNYALRITNYAFYPHAPRSREGRPSALAGPKNRTPPVGGEGRRLAGEGVQKKVKGNQFAKTQALNNLRTSPVGEEGRSQTGEGVKKR